MAKKSMIKQVIIKKAKLITLKDNRIPITLNHLTMKTKTRIMSRNSKRDAWKLKIRKRMMKVLLMRNLLTKLKMRLMKRRFLLKSTLPCTIIKSKRKSSLVNSNTMRCSTSYQVIPLEGVCRYSNLTMSSKRTC